MSLALHLRLRGEPEAAGIARRTIAAAVAGSQVDVEAVTLVVSELVGRLFGTGAAGEDPGVDVHVDVNAARLRGHVTAPPRNGEAPPERALAAGWSLVLMERMVDRWGIDDGPATRIWFEIDLATGQRAGAGTIRSTDPGASG